MILALIQKKAKSAVNKIKEAYKELENNWIMNRWYNKYFETVLESEVKKDLEHLRAFQDLPFFEREENPLWNQLSKKYREDYCPICVCEHDWLSRKNQERYFWLRTEIDEVLFNLE